MVKGSFNSSWIKLPDFLVEVTANNLDKNDFKTTDSDLPIGLSYFLSDEIELGATYNLGLTKVDNNTMSNYVYI